MNKIILILLLLPIIALSQSVYFDGDDYANEVVANYRSGDSKGTVIAWVNIATTNEDDYILSSADNGAAADYIMVGIHADGADTWMRLVVTNGVTNVIEGSTTDLLADTWYHLVWISNGSSYTFYVNGVSQTIEVTSGADNGNWFNSSTGRDNLTLGCLLYNGDTKASLIDAYIDEVAIFSDTLTQAQVTAYYNAGRINDLRDEANLVGYWKCNENTGTAISGVVGSEVFDFAAATEDPSWSTEHAPTTFYVSDQGSDTDDGEDETTALLTVDNAASRAVQPNDSVAIFTGDKFRETVTMDGSGTSGNPITVTVIDSATGLTGAAALALGDTAVISGADLVSGWTGYTGGSWQVADTITNNLVFSASGLRNYRNTMPANTSSFSGTAIRIKVEAGAGGTWSCDGASIGIMTTDDVFDEAPTRITWVSEDTVVVAESSTALSDSIPFIFTKTNRHGIHLYMLNRIYVAYVAIGPHGLYFDSNGDNTLTLDLNGDANSANVGLAKVEVYAPYANIWQTSNDSTLQVFFDDVRGTLVASVSNIDSTGQWYWDGSDSTLYVYYTEDPDGVVTIETTTNQATGINIDGKDYITIGGLTIEKTLNAGIYLEATDAATTNIIINNCILKNNYDHGIFAYDHARYIDTVTISNCLIYLNGATGISLSDYAKNFIIEDNTVYSNCQLEISSEQDYTAGILASVSANISNIIVQDNEVYLNRIVGGVGVVENGGAGIWFDTIDGYESIIRRNLVYDNRLVGLYIEETDSVEVYYNVVYGHDQADAYHLSAGIYGRRSSELKIYNNTLYDNLYGIEITGKISSPDTNGCINNIIKNNIVFGSIESAISAWNGGENDGTYGSGNIYTYNNWGLEDGPNDFAEWGKEVYKSTYDAWETAYGSSTNSVESDPLFTDAANDDFTLQAKSPCIDAGTSVGLVLDYIGNVVPYGGGLVDIGAYEMELEGGTSYNRYRVKYKNAYKPY